MPRVASRSRSRDIEAFSTSSSSSSSSTDEVLARCPGGLAVYLVLLLSLSLNSLWLLSTSVLSPALTRSAPASGQRPKLSLTRALSRARLTRVDPFDPEHNLPKEELSQLSLGSPDCATGALIELRSYLSQVVVTFYFKEDAAARAVSKFLHDLYGRFFKAVVVLGPQAAHDVGVEGRVRHSWGNLSGSGLEGSLRASTSSNVGPWSFTSGSFSYFSFPKVVAMHPEAEGYLWVEDSVVVNHWQLIRGNKSKLWVSDAPECLRCQGFIPMDHTLSPTVFDGWAGHPAVRQRARNAFSQLSDRYQQQFLGSVDTVFNVSAFPKTMVDAFYVPQRFAMQLAFDIIPSFREFGVVPEIAIPSMFYALDVPDDFDEILHRSDHRMEPVGPKYDALAFWTPYVTTFYHWDLSTSREKEKLIKAFSGSDSCVTELMLHAR